MATIKEILTENNSRDIKKVIDGRDDTCWFSNGSEEVKINLKLDGFVSNLNFEFQKGFHPAALELRGADTARRDGAGWRKEIALDANTSEANVELPAGIFLVDVIFKKSHDPYDRICVYQINAS